MINLGSSGPPVLEKGYSLTGRPLGSRSIRFKYCFTFSSSSICSSRVILIKVPYSRTKRCNPSVSNSLSAKGCSEWNFLLLLFITSPSFFFFFFIFFFFFYHKNYEYKR